jgi:hypothetical protein
LVLISKLEVLALKYLCKLQVNVKFKGCRLALGSSKLASATVSEEFMKGLSDLNIMLNSSKPQQRKKRKPEVIPLIDHIQVDVDNSENISNTALKIIVQPENLNHEIVEADNGDVVIVSDDNRKSYGGLKLPIVMYGSKTNRIFDISNLFTISLRSSQDFWNLMEQLKIFNFFSLKTHDVSILSLQGYI